VSAFSLRDSAPFTLGTVVLQVRTIGSELDYTSPVLSHSNGSGGQLVFPQPRVELNRALVPSLGATVSSLWQWDLSGLGVTSYEITFAAAEPSLSFDSLTLDTSEQFTPLFTAPSVFTNATPVIDRWMYPHNAAPCDRVAGSTFATLGDEAGVDTRHAQHLVGWDTGDTVPAGLGATNYLVTRCRLTLTINRGGLFVYDPTHDDYRTHLDPGALDQLPDEDPGRPVELFGVGYRNGFDAATFDQCSDLGPSAAGERNAFAASWFTNGTLLDVSNNVGKTNEAFPAFEAVPFAVGQIAGVTPGELVPAGAKVTFDLHLDDPFVLGYLRDGLNEGGLRFAVSSLHTSAGQTGTPNYPDFATRFNVVVVDPTRLELEVQVIGGGDLDGDGLPDDWELASLGGLTASATEDSDADGALNHSEWLTGTHPAVSTDALRLSVEPMDNQTLLLRWPHAANRGYRLEVTEDWVTWLELPAPQSVQPQPGAVEWQSTVQSQGAAGAGYYRLRMTNP
jgi:hypothetical protein